MAKLPYSLRKSENSIRKNCLDVEFPSPLGEFAEISLIEKSNL